jgi:hypothetical protein
VYFIGTYGTEQSPLSLLYNLSTLAQDKIRKNKGQSRSVVQRLSAEQELEGETNKVLLKRRAFVLWLNTLMSLLCGLPVGEIEKRIAPHANVRIQIFEFAPRTSDFIVFLCRFLWPPGAIQASSSSSLLLVLFRDVKRTVALVCSGSSVALFLHPDPCS